TGTVLWRAPAGHISVHEIRAHKRVRVRISQAGARLTRRVSSRSKSSTRSRPVANRACDTRPCPLSVSPSTGSDSSSLTAQEGQDQVHQDRTLVCRDCAEEFVF